MERLTISCLSLVSISALGFNMFKYRGRNTTQSAANKWLMSNEALKLKKRRISPQ